MRPPLFATLSAAVMLARPLAVEAQSVGKMLSDDFGNAGKDIVAIWTSPFHASSRDWMLAGASAGVFGLSMLADESVSDWALKSANGDFFDALSPVRRGGKLFAGKYVVPPLAATYIAGVAFKNQALRDLAMGCVASWGSQAAIRRGLYALVGRARPESLPDNNQQWRVPSGGAWEMHSFPAGHFANALSCATFANERFRLGPAGIAVYAVAGAVGVGRLADGAHWTSDTVIGGVLGYAVGREIARRSLRRKNEPNHAVSFQLSPDLAGLAARVTWTF
ncbi:MAG TPA: phosphatase PAP2 family protein [Gemmatimonadaceae bacterium]|nr:phosphatase PAP2 family protein [Gemmatimonadaceae bacterium]